MIKDSQLEMNAEWNIVVELIQSAKCIKLYSVADGWAFLTDRNGKRYKIERGMSFSEVSLIVKKIENINS